ncbi:TPR repeat-containing protein [Melioribacter roseus P3M-2]|uniref:TPR repeat-containing protein n=2 Tax=Melioribacteraceae TaxID=1334117 RepID=I6ZX88_MELRP|nr:TPR repeat-containing protein [Melioribacter roseus P3M-2]
MKFNGNYMFKRIFIFITLAFLFYSCSLWKNFTTYFNTYYNAKTIFERAEEDLLKEQTDPFAFRTEKARPQLDKEFTRVIEKCSRILQFDTESSYFDDALFLTGKAFYYQQEYARAQRKFIELSAIPESDYALENKLWLAKTHLQLRNFEEGLRLIEEVKQTSLAEEEYELFEKASITKIAFLLFREQYEDAVAECNEFLENAEDDETVALIYYQLGKIYLLLDNKEKALESFAKVLDFSPSFDVEFESRIEYARLLKDLGNVDESEELINDLLGEGKFKEREDRIVLELGNIYFEKGEIDKALDIYKDIDTTYKKKNTAVSADIMIGKIYEMYKGDFDSAYKYYNKAVTSPLIDKDLKAEIVSHNKVMDKYFKLNDQINDLNLQYDYAVNPDRFIRDSVDYDIAFKQYVAQNRQKMEQNASRTNNPLRRGRGDEPQQDSVAASDTTVSDTTNLSEKNLSLIELIAKGKAKKPTRPTISVDSIKSLIAQNLFEKGNLFYSELNNTDSALVYFNKVLDEYPESQFKVNTLYALGTYYESQGAKEKADSLFRIIYDNYPGHKLYTAAGRQLGLIEDVTEVKETGDPVEKLYVDAEKKYYQKNYHDAIAAFKNIYLQHPRSPYAPKSIYYIGFIYEEQAKNDSAAFYYRILTSKDYLSTPYGKAVVAKYKTYQDELERVEKEKAEKLNEAKDTVKIKEIADNEGSPDSVDRKKELMKKEVIQKEKSEGIKQDTIKPAVIRNEEKADSAKKKLLK